MATTPLQKKRIQQTLVVVLLLVMVVTAGVLWWGFFVTGTVPEGPAIPPRRVEVDVTILTNPILESLADPLPLVELPLTIGRDNPLVPSP